MKRSQTIVMRLTPPGTQVAPLHRPLFRVRPTPKLSGSMHQSLHFHLAYRGMREWYSQANYEIELNRITMRREPLHGLGPCKAIFMNWNTKW